MTKTHILDEIRRTAAANGGEPLGVKRFSEETGIRIADWQGKFWARWNDAVREAGFMPNELTRAYDKIDLLVRYAKLAQELGRLPSSNDLRLKGRSDDTFPHAVTIQKRFKTKAALVAELLAHCRATEGFDDVVRMCEEYVPRKQDTAEEEKARAETEIGFVYLMKSGRFYKIGMSNSVGRREYELGIQLPEPITTVHAIRTDDPPGIEAYWHNRFAAKRKNGEWFELDAADVAAFKRRKFM
jgi:hypothetical protein